MLDAQTQKTVAAAVKRAASSAGVVLAVQALYEELVNEVRPYAPSCEMSGRCCRFEQYGHRLYVTTAELAAFVAMARRLPCARHLGRNSDAGACRYQSKNLCTAYSLRPMGCRLFYCDERTREPLQTLFERMHGRLRELHKDMDVPYYYLEWREATRIIEVLLNNA